MSDDTQSGVTRQDLADEMPRSTTSDEAFRPKSKGARAVPTMVWLLLAVLVAVAFAALLWLLNPPSRGVGSSAADVVVPSAPPVRRP